MTSLLKGRKTQTNKLNLLHSIIGQNLRQTNQLHLSKAKDVCMLIAVHYALDLLLRWYAREGARSQVVSTAIWRLKYAQ